MRIRFVVITCVFISIAHCNAYDIPSMRNVNSIKVKLLPDAVNKSVKFSFDKQDLNGYSGTDPVVFSVTSPSGKTVWEANCPDDGNETGGGWEIGPRQSVECIFLAREKGIYTLQANTASEMDIQILFDHARAENTAWGLEVNSPRFSSGKLDVAVTLPPQKLGEKRKQVIAFCTTKRSKISNFRITAGSEEVLAPVSIPLYNGKKALIDYKYLINRHAELDIYEFTADEFSEIVSMCLPDYGTFMIFPEKRFARRFLNHTIPAGLLELNIPCDSHEMAFERGCQYQISYQSNHKKHYDFTATIFGTQYRFTPKTTSAQFSVPVDCAYSSLITTHAPSGKFQITRMTDAKAEPLQPAPGTILSMSKPFVWTAVTSATNYTVKFTCIDSSRSFEVNTSVNSLMPKDFMHKLSAGVWTWAVKGGREEFGKQSFFAIKQAASTQLPFIYEMTPAMDSTVTEKTDKISCRFALLKKDDLDFVRSRVKFNGKEFKLTCVETDLITTTAPISVIRGRNNVELELIDRYGNCSDFRWGFFVGNPGNPPSLSHDRNGNIYFYNTPFYPIIYYGYQYPKLKIEECGFNTVLTNTLPSENFLDHSLKRNIKVLDSGSVYHGFYSKDKSIATTEAEVKTFAATSMPVHPARLGAWMDEMDVHRSLDYIKQFLAYFGPSDRGWRGVCSCNRSFYDKMTQIGNYLMIDYYCGGKELFTLDDAFKAARKAAGEKPLMVLVSGFSRNDPNPAGFIPTNEDVTYTAFAALRLKANALGLYQCGEYRLESYREHWENAIKVYRQVSALRFITYGKDVQNTVKLVSTGGKVNFRAIEYKKKLYLIMQNCSFDAAIVSIGIPSFKGKLRVMFENRIINARNGNFTDCFKGADTHIYAAHLP